MYNPIFARVCICDDYSGTKKCKQKSLGPHLVIMALVISSLSPMRFPLRTFLPVHNSYLYYIFSFGWQQSFTIKICSKYNQVNPGPVILDGETATQNIVKVFLLRAELKIY